MADSIFDGEDFDDDFLLEPNRAYCMIWFVKNYKEIKISEITGDITGELIKMDDDAIFNLADDIVTSYFWDEFFETHPEMLDNRNDAEIAADLESETEDEINTRTSEAYEGFISEYCKKSFSGFSCYEDAVDALTNRLASVLFVVTSAARSGCIKLTDFPLWQSIYEDTRNMDNFLTEQKKNKTSKKKASKKTSSKASKGGKITKATKKKTNQTVLLLTDDRDFNGSGRTFESGEGESISTLVRNAFLNGKIDLVEAYIAQIHALQSKNFLKEK